MNYYASGGQAHGLKSLAQEVRKYGRNGDTILAHINPQEAGILKALGGSGTINPDTGLPEYFFKAISRAVAAPFKAINEVVKAVPVIGPAIDRGLVSLDKAVGSAIPGGWNTLAQTALAFTPLGLPAKVGLAALGGSGAFGPSGKFNFQRALLSGALAYGANQLAQGLQEAGGGVTQGGTTDVIAKNLGVEGAGTGLGSQAEMLARPEFGGGFDIVPRGLADAIPKEAALQAANTGLSNAAANPDVFSGLAGTQQIVPQPSAASNFASDFVSKTGANLSAAGQGIKNLTGFGTGAAEAASKFTGPVTAGGVTALGMGAMGLASLDEQEKALTQQYQQGSVNDAEYNRQMALIADGRRRAEEAIRANPYQFARGGSVDDELGGDYSAMGMDPGNMQKGLFGMGYAAGGQPRFLSGGGDGMSDSIPATINNKQPARLADGEFVVPADVVSHLGNGSSKAGAKRLYSMMDKVRQARTGKKEQAPAVNTKRLMPA
jgi:hypothetical protein